MRDMPPGHIKDVSQALAGKFIVVDGPDGAGKTTQLSALRDHLADRGAEVEVVIDPGTTEIGEKIRRLLLDHGNGRIGPVCETLLFMASRAQLVLERIRPALEAGKVVLCDRFVTATIAYQGACGIDPETIIELGRVATEGLWPDLTVILQVPAEVGMERLLTDRTRQRDPQAPGADGIPEPAKQPQQADAAEPSPLRDRMEARSRDYHERVVEIFKRLGDYYPASVRCVNAVGTVEEVFSRIVEAITEEFAR